MAWMRRSVSICVSGFLLAGCAGRRNVPPTSFDESRALVLLERSPTFIRYRKRTEKVSCLVDTVNGSEAVIDVGVMHSERFEKVHSFKIISNGAVYVYDVLANDDDPWKLDYRPGNGS